MQHKNLSGRKQRNDVPLRIVFEDDFLIVVEKREGLLSVGTARGKEEVTAHSLLNNYVRNTAPKGSYAAGRYGDRGAVGRSYAGGRFTGNRGHSAPRVYIVHRLDRETSGLMVFAKSEEIKHALQENWENVVTKRCYVAVVNGVPDGKYMPQEGTIRTWLKENSAFTVYSSFKDNGGQLAITNYKVLGTNTSARKTLIELELETGRKNQIRVHMQEMGMPIFGDKKYYGENPAQLAENKKARRLYLHAYILNFIHPVTGKEMKFTTGIPRLFHTLCSLVKD
ncbi:MAG: RluA family pseudouridine synthase [Bacteroidales bacterium]|nr:RluA family pseudouridine synthase [Bacteroidales bacterium]